VGQRQKRKGKELGPDEIYAEKMEFRDETERQEKIVRTKTKPRRGKNRTDSYNLM
jgi:hypothetical protein